MNNEEGARSALRHASLLGSAAAAAAVTEHVVHTRLHSASPALGGISLGPLSLPERGGNNGVVLRVLVSCENARYTVHGTQTSGPIGRAGCAAAGADHATRLAYSPRGLYVIIDAGSGGADAA